ncbi:uncharacterized protein STEHIDRAFT_156680 [Stereum hirsutum FP-91666 SS1]|uniref:uncharacterized protein n=1 Tax=Stereum hirsutum (strain FP-91666) TaxID=721885 RepID=UPI000440C56D|nr:uncharacterized protein STEHIDRAFT_156680 [Stereum hirsutum FP-91666 SS1]EIM86352.1 hypothetical protein STEHIDRAFT_156680 [Stereum hirsutum FP-91666 SS1]
MPASSRTHNARPRDNNQYPSRRRPANIHTSQPSGQPPNPIKRAIVHLWKRTSRAARRERESRLPPGFELVATPPPTPPRGSRARKTGIRSSSTRLKKRPQRQRSDSWVIV